MLFWVELNSHLDQKEIIEKEIWCLIYRIAIMKLSVTKREAWIDEKQIKSYIDIMWKRVYQIAYINLDGKKYFKSSPLIKHL